MISFPQLFTCYFPTLCFFFSLLSLHLYFHGILVYSYILLTWYFCVCVYFGLFGFRFFFFPSFISFLFWSFVYRRPAHAFDWLILHSLIKHSTLQTHNYHSNYLYTTAPAILFRCVPFRSIPFVLFSLNAQQPSFGSERAELWAERNTDRW